MADSREYRTKFFMGNFVFLGILVLILGVVFLLSGLLSGGKLDLTADGIYTISPATKEILSELKDKITVVYYSSEDLPSFLQNLRRDTKDTFAEFYDLSNGNFQYSIINPDEEAAAWAGEQAAAYEEAMEEYLNEKREYDAAVARGDTKATAPDRPEEPKPPQSIQDIFGGRPQQTDDDILKARQERAAAIAAQTEQKKEEVERTLLRDDFKRSYFQKLEQRGIGAFPITERQASSVRQVRVYSSIELKYLDKEPEVIPVHYSIESLEYELASRVMKLTTRRKPVVAFFDGRKPPMPEMNPMNPMQRPPPTEYEGITNYLNQFFDVRSIAIKENDSFDDLVKRLKDDVQREAGGASDDDSADEPLKPADYKLIKSVIIAQPDQLETRQVYEINRIASLGIPTVLLVSPYSVDISQQGQTQGLPLSLIFPGLDDVFRKWGLELGREILASNDTGAIQMRRMYGRLPVLMDAPLPVNVAAVGREAIDQGSPLTNRIQQLVFPATTGLRLLEKTLEYNGIEWQELARTTEESWSVHVDPVSRDPFRQNQPVGPSVARYEKDLARMKDPEEFTDFVDSVPLAVLLKGKMPFTFQGETIPEWKPEPEPDPAGAPGGIPGMPPGMRMPPGMMPPGGDRALRIDGEDPLAEGATAAAGDAAPDAEPAAAAAEPAGEPEASVASEAPAAPETPAAPVEEDAAATPPAEEPGASAEPAVTPEPVEEKPKADLQVVPGTVLVLASVDMLKNDFLMQQGGDFRGNVQFFQNVLDTFGLGNKLLEIQRKQLTAREFESDSEGLSRLIMVFGVGGIPAIVVFVGIAYYMKRRRESIAYERAYVERD